MPMHRWAGGKRWLAETLLEVFSSFPGIRRLMIPFYGGGGESHLAMGRDLFARYALSDANEALVEAHLCVRDEWEALIPQLTAFARLPLDVQRSEFLRFRTRIPTTRAGRALRVFVLVGSSFNGLWRENDRGVFNAPWGRPFSVDAEAVREVGCLLRGLGVTLRACDFGDAVAGAAEGDLVYADPPYLPAEGETASFDAYGGKRFPVAEHLRLSRALQAAAGRGAACLLSNHDSELVRSIYPGDVRILEAPRRIAADPTRRGKTREVLITIRRP